MDMFSLREEGKKKRKKKCGIRCKKEKKIPFSWDFYVCPLP